MKTTYAIVVCAALLATVTKADAKRHLKWTKEDLTNVRRDSNGVIQIGPPGFTTPDVPTVELARALRHYPHDNQFRVTWCEGQGFSWVGTALYNRKKRIVTLHLSEHISGKDGDGGWNLAVWERYINVTDNTLARLAEWWAEEVKREKSRNEGYMVGEYGGFETLDSFEVTKINFQKKTRRNKQQ
jgi:hypothetical protein